MSNRREHSVNLYPCMHVYAYSAYICAFAHMNMYTYIHIYEAKKITVYLYIVPASNLHQEVSLPS